MVQENNIRAKEICCSKMEQSSFQWLEPGKYWSDLTTIFIQSYVFLIWESVTLLILSQRYKWNSWKDNAGECCVWKSFFFYLLLNIWRVFASMSYFCYWNFLAFLGNWFLFYKFITTHQCTIYILYIHIYYLYIYTYMYIHIYIYIYIYILSNEITDKRHR